MRERIDRTGETRLNKFGSEMVITVYRNCNDIDVCFPEYNWTAEHVSYGQFKNGRIKCPYEPRVYGVGYVGEGDCKAFENGNHTKVYDIWKHMIRRCYDYKFQEKCHTYIECKVCDEWLNFQAFASWYEENYYEIPGEQMTLDKDILIKGNKIYSPDTCVFVSQSINKLFTKRDAARGDLPIGVTYNKKSKKYQAQCAANNKQNHLGFYNTSEEAFNVYKQVKEAYIKKVANDYLELIPFNLYQAMINYEVDIDD